MTALETRDGLSGSEGEAAPRTEKTGFEIDGEHYALPTLDSITLDEERVLYIYADTIIEDFIPAAADATEDQRLAHEMIQLRKLRDPDFKRALAHIAYRRKNPDAEDSEINVMIGGANALAVSIAMLRGDDEDPPATTSQKQPENRSDTSELSSLTDSGRDTENTSDPADASRASTGTTESDTSSPGVVPIASVR